MKMGLFSVLFNDKPLEEVAKYAADLGYEAFELAAWRGSNHFDTDRAATDPQYAKGIKKMLADHGIEISGALEPPLVADGAAVRRLVARRVGRHVRQGRDGQVRHRAHHQDGAGRLGARDRRRQRLLRLDGVGELVHLAAPAPRHLREGLGSLGRSAGSRSSTSSRSYGVKFAHEVHPTEIAYNVYTAREAVKRMPRDDWGFNFDPSHFIWQQIDPVVFIKEFGTRIFHAHAKDWELQKDILHIDGVTGTGSWQRGDRAARYRVPGWGDVEWRRVITALLEVGYDFVLSFEHEDPVMSEEDGCEQCIKFLKPLFIKKPLVPGQAWWLA